MRQSRPLNRTAFWSFTWPWIKCLLWTRSIALARQLLRQESYLDFVWLFALKNSVKVPIRKRHHDHILIIFQHGIAVFAEPWRSPYKCRMVDIDNILGMKIQFSTFCLVLKFNCSVFLMNLRTASRGHPLSWTLLNSSKQALCLQNSPILAHISLLKLVLEWVFVPGNIIWVKKERSQSTWLISSCDSRKNSGLWYRKISEPRWISVSLRIGLAVC
jgi:hypothetical protein